MASLPSEASGVDEPCSTWARARWPFHSLTVRMQCSRAICWRSTGSSVAAQLPGQGHQRQVGGGDGPQSPLLARRGLAARRRMATPMTARSYMSAVCSTHQPWFSSPSRLASGTRASVRKVSLKRASPVAWRSGRTSTPGCFMGKKKNVMPRCLGWSQSVRAMSRA